MPPLIGSWQSGKVFSVVNSGAGVDNPIESDGRAHGFNNRAIPQNANGADRPNTIAYPRLSHKTLSEFFNTVAFAPQPLGTVGTTQRNSIFGPHFRDFDLSIFKNFPVTERATIQSVPRRSTSPTLRTSSSAITTSRTRSSARQPLVRSQQPIQTTTHGSTSSYSKYCSNLR